MPTWIEVLGRLATFTAAPAAIGVMLTAGILVIIQDWRISVFTLVIQYILVGLLLMTVIRPEVAVIKMLVGTMICPVFYLTARRVGWGRAPEPIPERAVRPRWYLPTEMPFRLLAVLIVMLATYRLAAQYPLPELPPAASLATYTLVALGMLALGLTEEPLKAGMGLLTFMAGFELFYAALEPSISVIGLLGLINFLITLATSYLTAARAGLGGMP